MPMVPLSIRLAGASLATWLVAAILLSRLRRATVLEKTMTDARKLSDAEIGRLSFRYGTGTGFARAVIAAAMDKAGLAGERIEGYIRVGIVPPTASPDMFFSPGRPCNDMERAATLIVHPPAKPQRTPEERIAAALAIRQEGSSLDDYARCHSRREQAMRGDDDAS